MLASEGTFYLKDSLSLDLAHILKEKNRKQTHPNPVCSNANDVTDIKWHRPCLFLEALAFPVQFSELKPKYSTCVWHTWLIYIYINYSTSPIIKASAACIRIPLKISWVECSNYCTKYSISRYGCLGSITSLVRILTPWLLLDHVDILDADHCGIKRINLKYINWYLPLRYLFYVKHFNHGIIMSSTYMSTLNQWRDESLDFLSLQRPFQWAHSGEKRQSIKFQH